MNIEQQKEKELKVLKVIKNYVYTNNLDELSRLLDIPTSSLQRYLKEDSKKYISKTEYQNIVDWLRNSKSNGLKNGGKKSQELYGYSKDSDGHFTGIRK